ncbi:hypothetical protein [Actinoplanes sp. RD1]|uniref:hypothetical protein n=1 Tax=Actinoplanes sp. RD1 TaxID=3064538 RepID=UPI00274290F2|nr:hypothetical protein [Actinoplanes sp. RD1]
MSDASPLARHRELIGRVRERCDRDPAVTAALMYGSFVDGSADEHSDIEFWLFGPVPDPAQWIAAVEPPLHVIRNEFGAHVAFFPGLIRGEFHFAPATETGQVATWPAGTAVDVLKGSIPAPAGTADTTADVCGRFANWLLLAWHVGRRGETLRRRDALAHAQRHLLGMARRAAGTTGHRPTPSRRAEAELPAWLLAGLDRTHDDVGAAWQLGRALWLRLDPHPPDKLIAEMDRMLHD